MLADIFLIPQRREMKSHQNLETQLQERAECTNTIPNAEHRPYVLFFVTWDIDILSKRSMR